MTATTIAVTWIATAFVLGVALGAFFGYGAGLRERARTPVAPQPTPRPASRRREWAADFAHARAVLGQDTYRPRHGLVMAHVAASIGRPPAGYALIEGVSA